LVVRRRHQIQVEDDPWTTMPRHQAVSHSVRFHSRSFTKETQNHAENRLSPRIPKHTRVSWSKSTFRMDSQKTLPPVDVQIFIEHARSSKKISLTSFAFELKMRFHTKVVVENPLAHQHSCKNSQKKKEDWHQPC
jgi:hypothetical protein